MRKLIFTLGFMTLATGPALAAEQQARIEVSGLWCPSCAFIVGEALQKTASVKIAEFAAAEDGASGVYTITFDDALTNVEEIAAQPLEYGYTAVVLSVGASNS